MKKAIRQKNSKKRSPLKISLTILAGLFLIVIIVYLYIAYLLPIPESLFLQPAHVSTKIFDRHGKLLYEVLNPEQGRKTYLAIDKMPADFIHAIVASEDSDYYNHIGVDLGAISRAFIYNSLEQKITSGASTITQQLVRNLMGTNRERNLQEKIIESIYAVRLSHAYSKDQILEEYLNTVYFGNLSYGAASAALHYFDKNLYDLDLAELSMLAGLPQSPSNFNPLVHFEKAKTRQKYVLDRMVQLGYITQKENDDAYGQPLKFGKAQSNIQAPHFVQYVLSELEKTYGEDRLYHDGLQITTTLDLDLQQKAEQIIDNQLARLAQKHVTNSALLAADTDTGQILVWVGSKDFFDDSIDGQVDIITSLRQPGSALKPFLYLLALERGETLATIIADLPFTVQTANGNYSPLNYDLDFHGPVRLREALANSFNIPAVKTLQRIGIANFLNYLHRFGLNSLDQSPEYYGLALTLGGGEVRLFDMVKAYLTLANYGRQKNLSYLLEIKQSVSDDHGQTSSQTLQKWLPSAEQYLLGTFGQQNAYLIISTLSDSNARLKSFGEGNVLELPFPAAVKTGTTRDFKDNWTFGFSKHLMTGVWVGNADATAMENISGIDGAGPIWHDFMAYAEPHIYPLKSADFTIPPRLNQIEICAASGLLPGELCPEKIREWFLSGTEPKIPDSYWQKFLCSSDKQEKIFLNYPPEYRKWAQDRDLLPPPDCRSLVALGMPVTASGTSSSAAADQSALPTSITAPTSLEPITISSPLAGDSFQIDPNLPLTSQKIPLHFTINNLLSTTSTLTTYRLEIFINDRLVETRSFTSDQLHLEQSFFWLPERGVKQLKIELSLSGSVETTSKPIEFTIQ